MAYAHKPHILIIDDDTRLRGLIKKYLSAENLITVTAKNALDAEEILQYLKFDLLILDVNMPGKTGLEFLSSLRRNSDVPVLMLTALGEPGHRIMGLETGADDYLPKPFEPKELLLRIRSILRRQQKTPAQLKLGNYTYEVDSSTLRFGNEVINLTTAENTILAKLALNNNKTVRRTELGESERAVDVIITRLRKKIEDDPKKPVYIQTIRSEGYKLVT